MLKILNIIQSAVLKATRFMDIMLVFLLVAIISLMILPMPTILMDGLIAANLGFSVILLMMSIYIAKPTAFSTYPTLLLFTTLYRLSIGISATRLILLKAKAGDIIFTFGTFVVGGNLVVGAVVYLIITIVQFLVITKGSERVAEVAARFTLDAMPGKQMSIDADMRAGLIDMTEAKRRRNEVEKESQLYGAMDGAMKFVKGDAIAGLIILAVNILGGIAIGVLQKDMELARAVQTYSILTVGEGLVSQIPALFNSVTAGIIVTRVTSEEIKNLGADIGGQIIAQPKALLIGGALIVVMALIPGFPKLQFIMIGLLVGGSGYTLYKFSTNPPQEMPGMMSLLPAGQRAAGKKPAEGDEFALMLPLLIEIDSSVQESIRPEVFNEELLQIRRALYYDLGVPFPGISLRFNRQIEAGTYTILLQEIPMSQGKLRPGMLLVREKEENLKILGMDYVLEKKFLPNLPAIWVDQRYREQLEKAGIPFMDLSQVLTYHLSILLKRHAGEFIGLQETRILLDKIEEQFPELVKEVQRVLPVQKITEVLKRLVQEEISIRDLRSIIESLIEWGQKEKDVILLTEYIRSSLKRYISYKYSGGQNILGVYLLTPDLEETFRKAIRQTSGGSYLSLDPQVSKKIIEAIKKEVGDLTESIRKPVLLTSMDIRRYVRKLIEQELYDLPTISYQELTQEIIIQPLEKIGL